MKTDLTKLFEEAQARMGDGTIMEELDFWAWPQAFGDSTGPHGGCGGQSMTQFQCYAFESQRTGKRLKTCDGVWRAWDGQQGW